MPGTMAIRLDWRQFGAEPKDTTRRLGPGMRDFGNVLKAEAESRSQYWQNKLREVEAAFLRGEGGEAELKAAQTMADLARQRLAGYARRSMSFYPCPRCWIDHGQRGTRALHLPMANGFRCDTCDWSVTFSARPDLPEVWRCF
jgi:hypothetical protein